MTNDFERQAKFEIAFINDVRQLPSVLVTVIENLNLEAKVGEPPLNWGKNTLDGFYDNEPQAPRESSFRLFLELSEVSSSFSPDVSKLLDFWNVWLEENPEASGVVATQTREPASASPPAVAPPKVVPVLVTWGITWAPDGSTVTIGDRVIDLTANNKEERKRIHRRIDAARTRLNLTWKQMLTKSGETSPSTFSNLALGNTGVNQDRAERWAKAVGMTIPELFGLKMEAPKEAPPPTPADPVVETAPAEEPLSQPETVPDVAGDAEEPVAESVTEEVAPEVVLEAESKPEEATSVGETALEAIVTEVVPATLPEPEVQTESTKDEVVTVVDPEPQSEPVPEVVSEVAAEPAEEVTLVVTETESVTEVAGSVDAQIECRQLLAELLQTYALHPRVVKKIVTGTLNAKAIDYRALFTFEQMTRSIVGEDLELLLADAESFAPAGDLTLREFFAVMRS